MGEFSGLIDNVIEMPKQSAVTSAVTSIEDDPEQASRAIKLGEASGADPNTVFADVESFDRQFKGTLTSQIIQRNSHLQDYINSHPMASKVSNDDWGQLDVVSEHLKPFGDLTAAGTLKNFSKGFDEGYGPHLVGDWIRQDPEWEGFAQRFPYSAAAWYLMGAPIEIPLKLLGGVIHGGAEAVGGWVGGLSKIAGAEKSAEDIKDITKQTIITSADMYFTGRMSGNIHPTPGVRQVKAHDESLKKAVIQAYRENLEEVESLIRPYIEAGEPIPAGLHPALDKIKVEQSKLDAKALDNAFSEVQKSSTKERSAELLQGFIRQHSEAEIGVSADAIRKLYGDKEPLPDDNILGWVPDIVERLREAEATGGDVEIPLADWLTKADAGIAKELHDDIRVRPGGVTINEGKELKEPTKVSAQEGGKTKLEEEMEEFTKKNNLEPISPEQIIKNIQARIRSIEDDRRLSGKAAYGVDEGAPWPPNAELFTLRNRLRELQKQQNSLVDSVRTQAALDPLFQEGPIENLKLKKVPPKNEFGSTVSHNFKITDEKGRDVGAVLLTEKDKGKTIYIEWIGGGNDKLLNFGTNQFSKGSIRSLGRQLRVEFPNAEFLEGERISGARDQSGKAGEMVRVPLKAFKDEVLDLEVLDLESFNRLKELFEGIWTSNLGKGIETLSPTDTWTKHEQAIIDKVQDVLDRLVPNDVETVPARAVKFEGREVQGLHLQYPDDVPIIVWSLSSRDPVHTARHEALHQLRQYGLFSKEEWAILENAALDNGWFEKHSIDQRYSDAKMSVRIEEAIAEEFAEWNQAPKSNHPVAKLFEKLKEILDQIKSAIKEVLGFEPTWQDLFKKANEGEVGRREPEPISPDVFNPRAQEVQPELPGLTRQEDLDLFAKAKDIGMNTKQYKQYQELIAKREAEDIEAQLKRSLKAEERRQTKEWKENAVRVRDEVAVDIENRPDMAVGAFFRNGILYGEDTHRRLKLDRDSLTPEQVKSLPEQYHAAEGINSSDVASLFGYQSGEALVESLIKYEKDRGDLSHSQFKEKMIALETEKRMEKQFGDLDQNILSEARDHVLGQTQMDLLHEETVALGMKAGSEMPFAKKDIKEWIEGEFAKANAAGVKSSKYLESAGKAGRLAELALLDGEPAEAFRQKQRQYFSALLAREAKKFEKEQAQADRLFKRLAKREVSGTEQEFTNFIHSLMVQAEIPVKRTASDLAYELEKSGYSSFDSFVSSKVADGWELDAPDSILTNDIKSIGQMTVQEFREFNNTIKSLAHIGREVSKIEIAGKKQDFAEWKAGVLENIRELPPRTKEKQRNILYGFDAELTRLEEIVKDLDLRRELGPLYNALIRPMMEGKHKEFQLQEGLVKRLTGLREGNKEWRKTLNDTIPQDFFIDPDTKLPFDLSREHMVNIMLNFGNKSNIEKFTQGWAGKDGAAGFEQQLRALFNKHAKKEDWDFVRKVGEIFKDWKEDSDNLYRNLSGIAPKWLDIQEGGWYFPVIYDKFYSDINAIAERKDSDALFGGNYFRATTSNSYTKTRTGYVGRVEFQNTLEQAATRMQQTMHDISYRSAVMQASKVIYDKEIKAAIRKHYGSEYEAQLDPWLKAIANQYSVNEREISTTNAFLRRVRMNLVVNALGLNLKQLGSPDVGVLTPASMWRAMKFLDDDTKFAMENSREIPHTLKVMDRDFRESLDRTIATHGMEGFQASAARFAFIPMAKLSQRFRIATWTQKYREALPRVGHADAVEIADSFVRERHGATGIPDMPAIMRGSETRKLITLFYGFGNATYNWQRQIPGAIRRGDWETTMAAAYGAVLIPSAFGIALYNSRKEDDSWFKIIAKGLALQMGQTVAHARDVLNYAIEDQSPRSPLASAALALKSAASDAYKYTQSKQINKPIQHAANVVGLGLGLPGAQIGRTSQFLSDVSRGKQRPRNFQEYLRGIIHGEARLKK